MEIIICVYYILQVVCFIAFGKHKWPACQERRLTTFSFTTQTRSVIHGQIKHAFQWPELVCCTCLFIRLPMYGWFVGPATIRSQNWFDNRKIFRYFAVGGSELLFENWAWNNENILKRSFVLNNMRPSLHYSSLSLLCFCLAITKDLPVINDFYSTFLYHTNHMFDS